MDVIKLVFVLGVIGWVTWWVIATPSRSQGVARAMVVTTVCLLLSCVGVKF